MERMTPLLTASDLAIGHGGKKLISGIDLCLEPGSVLCLLGPNGAGKTTLFRTLPGLIPAIRGEIRLAGEPLSRLSRVQIASRLAHVPQSLTTPFAFTALDIVLMGAAGAFLSAGCARIRPRDGRACAAWHRRACWHRDYAPVGRPASVGADCPRPGARGGGDHHGRTDRQPGLCQPGAGRNRHPPACQGGNGDHPVKSRPRSDRYPGRPCPVAERFRHNRLGHRFRRAYFRDPVPALRHSRSS